MTEWINHNGYIQTEDLEQAIEDIEDMDEPDDEDLEAHSYIDSLLDEIEQHVYWNRGSGDNVTLIAEDQFEDYAKEYADGIGRTNTDEWPYNHIDWEDAADELKLDFTEIDVEGITYWCENR